MSPYRRRKKMFRRSRSSLVWLLVISIVVIIIAAVLGLGGGLINFLEKNANVLDNQYIPADLDRRTVDALKEKVKDIDPNKLEQLKREFFERQSRQQGKQKP